MSDLLKKAVPATVLALCASFAFAGMPSVKQSADGYSGTVLQADPAPDCKKNPTDPKCKDKK